MKENKNHMPIIDDVLRCPLSTLSFEVTIDWDSFKHLNAEQIADLQEQVVRQRESFVQLIESSLNESTCLLGQTENVLLTCPHLRVS